MRAGIIPYVKYKNKILYALGVDSVSGQLTDFGGRFDKKKDKNIKDTAIREFREESLNVFGILTIENIKPNLTFSLNNSTETFVEIFVNPIKAKKEFIALKNNKYLLSEISDICWLTEDQLEEIVIGNPFYNDKPVLPLYYKVRDAIKPFFLN